MPEVFVSWKNDRWEVTSNREEMPQLRISNAYKDLMTQARDSKDVREYIRGKIRDGNFLIKSIHQRRRYNSENRQGNCLPPIGVS